MDREKLSTQPQPEHVAELKAENARLHQMVAELLLRNQQLRETLAGSRKYHVA